jgi:hypothetical protein
MNSTIQPTENINQYRVDPENLVQIDSDNKKMSMFGIPIPTAREQETLIRWAVVAGYNKGHDQKFFTDIRKEICPQGLDNEGPYLIPGEGRTRNQWQAAHLPGICASVGCRIPKRGARSIENATLKITPAVPSTKDVWSHCAPCLANSLCTTRSHVSTLEVLVNFPPMPEQSLKDFPARGRIPLFNIKVNAQGQDCKDWYNVKLMGPDSLKINGSAAINYTWHREMTPFGNTLVFDLKGGPYFKLDGDGASGSLTHLSGTQVRARLLGTYICKNILDGKECFSMADDYQILGFKEAIIPRGITTFSECMLSESPYYGKIQISPYCQRCAVKVGWSPKWTKQPPSKTSMRKQTTRENKNLKKKLEEADLHNLEQRKKLEEASKTHQELLDQLGARKPSDRIAWSEYADDEPESPEPPAIKISEISETPTTPAPPSAAPIGDEKKTQEEDSDAEILRNLAQLRARILAKYV